MSTGKSRGEVVTFYSFKGGVGRTMALANVAWILASNGYRVLTIDWDLESPGLHRYFAPFLADRDLRHSPGVIDAVNAFVRAAREANHGGAVLSQDQIRRLASVKDLAISLERYEFPHGGSVDFIPAGQQLPEYSRMVSNFDWEYFYADLPGEAFLNALADDMRDSYDFALIDSRTGLSDNAGICTVTLPDVVVNCFTFNNQSIEGAAATARDILKYQHRIKIYPVPTRVEDGEAAKLDRRRNLAQSRFNEYVIALGHTDPIAYWGAVEIPYKVFYAYEETLAVFGERAHQENTLLAAYERLTSELAGRQCSFPLMPEVKRRGWLAEFEQRGAEPGIVQIVYTPRHRIWADWIAYELRSLGQRIELHDVTSGDGVMGAPAGGDNVRIERAVVLLSQEATQTQSMVAWWQQAISRDAPAAGRFLIPVRIDGHRLSAPFDIRESVDMFNVSAHHARDALLTRLDLQDTLVLPGGTRVSGPSPRFPYEPARVFQAPARNLGFIGRDSTLNELRERLNATTAQSGPVVLQGIGGVGKTQIAMEYVHRFAADYDVVWWVSAEQQSVIVTGLANLAQELGLPNIRAEEQVRAVLEALRRGEPSPRWLIVFDNNDDPERLRAYIPAGGGDVIVTTPGEGWSRQAWTLDVNVFDRPESIDLLVRRVPTLAHEEADAIAAKLGDLPLAVEQAATWLSTTAMSASNYLELLDEELPRILSDTPPPGYPHPAAETWRISQRRLRESTPAAAHLVELFAFLAPEPISTELLHSSAMVDALVKHDAQLGDRLFRSSLVREVARFGLARVDTAINAVRMHRLVQSVIKNDLPQEDQLDRQRQIHVILAKAAPDDAADRESWPKFEALMPHILPSGSLESDDATVLRFLVEAVRYLRYRGDLTGGEELATKAIEEWTQRRGEEDVYVLRMRGEQATILSEMGEHRRAATILDDVVERMTRTLPDGAHNPYTLVALGAAAFAHRGLAEYERARDLDRANHVRWQAIQGEEGERTLLAANSLGISLRLVGEFEDALAQAENTYRQFEKTRGARHLWTLLAGLNVGGGYIQVGDLSKALAVLERARSDCRQELGESHNYTLSAEKSLAVALRRLGRLAEARQTIDGARQRFESATTPENQLRLAYELEAACLSSAEGDHAAAVAKARETHEHYAKVLGPNHLNTLAAASDLGVFHLRNGDHTQAVSILQAAAQGMEALPSHKDEGKTYAHPFALMCQINLANAIAASGDDETSLAMGKATHADLLHWFSNLSHPAVIAAAANVAAGLSALGDRSAATALRDETLRRAEQSLGYEHPHTVSVRDWKRINIDIEPLET